ncbi:predicted protein [Naegleria gruberi]|uniref:Predicted protein n=1 Tax=Naegleria gruberi TaxID=5762 RepID=D2VQW4_NAEGR|nr:uncharacterized protein NAEGRDRAFT_71369 [Naegleria gruberi]EFC40784.1 predicted protein [Naegleria gruberi]|eukprot:XP_002673528.1 predicted protein [Naegleria gruberi strain NEG-M]
MPQLAKVHMEGFEQSVRMDSKYFNNSFRIKPCMFLIRNGKVAKSWRHNYADACPNIIKDLVLHMDKTIASPISDLIIDSLLANATDKENSHSNNHSSSEREVMIEIEGASQQSAQPITTDQVTTVNTTFANMGGIMKSIESFFSTVPRYKMIPGTSDLQSLSTEMKQSLEQDSLNICKSKERNIPKSRSCFAADIEFYQNIDPKTIDVNMILQTDHFRKYFKIMSSKEYNSENIIFWEDINLKYKPLTSKFNNFSKAKIVAESIGKYFLFDESSIMYVNTRDKLRQDVKFKISEIFSDKVEEDFFLSQAPLLFDEVLNEMTASVLQDMFIRFSVSDLFSEMIQTRIHK